ncbi:unnamed protein product [Ranitomeya imitator]|uniref:Uncharacterized protein n=1 Tax=Ranitomeya imitator TaxID=111125 RepID=A0ABN9L1P6_9NEOB|nr:unnamed protein product [Ranitomeya imitator]
MPQMLVESAQRRHWSKRLAQSDTVQKLLLPFQSSAIVASTGQRQADVFGTKSYFSPSEHAQAFCKSTFGFQHSLNPSGFSRSDLTCLNQNLIPGLFYTFPMLVHTGRLTRYLSNGCDLFSQCSGDQVMAHDSEGHGERRGTSPRVINQMTGVHIPLSVCDNNFWRMPRFIPSHTAEEEITSIPDDVQAGKSRAEQTSRSPLLRLETQKNQTLPFLPINQTGCGTPAAPGSILLDGTKTRQAKDHTETIPSSGSRMHRPQV